MRDVRGKSSSGGGQVEASMITVGSSNKGEEIESEMEEVRVPYLVVMVEEREEVVSMKDGGVSSFIFFKSGLCMFQVPL